MAQLASKSVPISVLLLFPRLLSAPEFGVVALHLATISIIVVALSLNVGAGVTRFLYRQDVDAGSVLGTGLLILAASFVALAPATVVVSQRVFGSIDVPLGLAVLQIPIAFSLSLEIVVSQYLISVERYKALSVGTSIKAVLVVGLSLYFVSSLKESSKYLGVIYAELFGLGVLVVYALWVFRDLQLRFSKPIAIGIFKYSIPTIVFSASAAILSQSDRIIVARVLDLEQAGIYSLNYAVGGVGLLVLPLITNFFKKDFFSALNSGRLDTASNNATSASSFAVLSSLIMVPFGGEVVGQIGGSSYGGNPYIVPIVGVSVAVQSYFAICNRYMFYEYKTGAVATFLTAGVILNLVLNVSLVPYWGLTAAAASTLASQMLMVLLVSRRLRSHGYRLPTLSSPALAAILILAGLLVLSRLI